MLSVISAAPCLPEPVRHTEAKLDEVELVTPHLVPVHDLPSQYFACLASQHGQHSPSPVPAHVVAAGSPQHSHSPRSRHWVVTHAGRLMTSPARW